MKKAYKYLIAYVTLLSVFTVYVLMDTFVISRVYSDAADAVSAAESGEEDIGVSPADSYTGDNASIDLYEFREYDTTVHVADVNLTSPEYLKTALAYGQYGKNVRQDTSEMAADNNAVLAINGDYYGTREHGYVIKNGTLYRDSAVSVQEDLVIYSDGSYEIVSEDEVTAEELLTAGAMQTLSFGPTLVEDGEIAVGENEEISGKSMASNPRTAIGIIDETHYVFVVSDGRTDNDAGLSLYQLAKVMQELGVKTAYNLDGGGTSTMYFKGEVVNTPTGGRAGHGSGTERSVSDIVYVGY